MTRARPRRPRPPPSALSAAIPPTGPSTAELPVIDRPDGWYWQAPDGHQVFGPFETCELARANRDRFDEQRPMPGESLQQAESEIGIASWIDPETGEPAEGPSPPHLHEP